MSVTETAQPSSPSSGTGTLTPRIGSQEPRVRICPEYATTYGDGAAALAERYAYPLDPWELDVLDVWLGRDVSGRPVAITCGLCVPRQNGKNYCIEIFELFCATVLGWHVLHTAHEVKTSMKAFNRVCSYFSGPRSRPEMRDMVQNIRRTNGQECITLTNGGIIEFSARSRQAARGFDDVQVVVLDEAQEIVPEQMDALMSTLSASSTGTRQLIYTGTPTPPNSPGTVMARLRRQVLAGDVTSCCWHEWSVESMPEEGSSFSDVLDDVYATNPAMGIRLDIDFTMQEFATLTLDGFARERLGWWQSVESQALISKADWNACGLADVPDMSSYRVAYGVKFAVDGSIAALSVAAVPADSKRSEAVPHVELVDVRGSREGVDWIADWLEERSGRGSCVVIDGLYGRDVLVNRLDGRFPRKGIVRPSPNDVATAASMFKERVDTHSLTWFVDEGQERLRKSALESERRDIGTHGAWGFGGYDPTPVESASLAVWGVMTTRRRAGRKLRVG